MSYWEGVYLKGETYGTEQGWARARTGIDFEFADFPQRFDEKLKKRPKLGILNRRYIWVTGFMGPGCRILAVLQGRHFFE